MVCGCFSWFELSPLGPVKGNLMLQHTMIFQMILCFQLWGNSLGKALSCFSMTMPPCTKRGPFRNGLSRSVWKNLTGLQSPGLNPTEHLWDEFERRLRARPNRPTSVPGLTNALVAEWRQIPTAMFQHPVESLPRRVEAVKAAIRGGDQLQINTHDIGMR